MYEQSMKTIKLKYRINNKTNRINKTEKTNQIDYYDDI